MSSRNYKKVNLKRLTWCQWRITDPYDTSKYTRVYLSVYEPTWERPYASLLCKFANGGGEIFFRFACLDDAIQVIVIPGEYMERLATSLAIANQQADQIESDMRLAIERRNLSPGARLVRTDTGEIVAEAERYLEEIR